MDLREGLEISTVLPRSHLPGILDNAPLDARIQGWKAKTQREFDPLEDEGLWLSKTIPCPTCRYPIDASQSPNSSLQSLLD
jgi:hypothetical protein